MYRIFSYLSERNAFHKVDYQNLKRAHYSSLFIAFCSPVFALFLYAIRPDSFSIYGYGLLGLFLFSAFSAIILRDTLRDKSAKKRRYYRLQSYCCFFFTFCILFYLAFVCILCNQNITGYAIALIYLALVPVFPLGFHKALLLLHIIMTVVVFFMFQKNFLFVVIMLGLAGMFALISLWKYYRISLYLQYLDHKHSIRQIRNKDQITGLSSYAGLIRQGKKIWKLARKENSIAASIVFQMDFIEEYRQTYGQDAVEILLQNMAQIMKEITKPHCSILARTDDNQFIALLFDVDKTGIYLAAKRIKQSFEHIYNPEEISDKHNVTIAGGISLVKTASPKTSVEQLLKNSYESLAFALGNCGNCIAHHTTLL